jgi:uncharacterized protein (DUF169 family)
MINLKKINEALNSFIRPQSPPVAVRMCENLNEIPKKVRFPKRDLGLSITACQGIAMARRYGWTVAIGKEDQICPHGHAILGFVSTKAYLDGSLAEDAGLGTKVDFARNAQELSLLEHGKYSHLIAAPINIAQFEPHFIMCFGNPAQIAVLVQAATAKAGGFLSSVSSGGRSCSVFIARTIIADECQVVLSGAGDRYFALTQDHEMAFTIPMSKSEATIEGLELAYKSGFRYPTPSWLRFEGQLPPQYYKFTELLLKSE